MTTAAWIAHQLQCPRCRDPFGVATPCNRGPAMSVSPKCPEGQHGRTVYIDPTGGSAFMGGPARMAVCSNCGWEMPSDERTEK